MKAYIISIGEGKAKEANKDIYKQKLKGVLEELNAMAEKFTGAVFKKPAGKFAKKIDLTEKYLEEGLKEDTVHIICGSTNKTYFWANINEIEIS